MKLTKIVCTIGPASEKKETIKKLIKAGMNVARLNFSHGTHRHHAKLIRNIRSAAKELGEPVAIIQDLQGPRIRIGELADNVEIKKGETVVLVPQSEYKKDHAPTMLPNHYPRLAREVAKGKHVLIADGTIDLVVKKIIKNQLRCSVVVGGVVKSHKGINVPGATLLAPSLTSKDRDDLAFGVRQGVDYVALSFVKNAKDIRTARSLLKRLAEKHPAAARIGIIPKIEQREAVRNFEEILKISDAVMIARGDLGIQIPAQKIPIIQKELIQKCIAAFKPVIVATQMLESMTTNSRPTRAEVSDVANAIIDHTDAIMLSGESASGQYPVQTVMMMTRIAKETERSRYDDLVCERIAKERAPKHMIAHAACDIARTKKIKLILVMDDDAELIRALASHRPEIRIVGFSQKPMIRYQRALVRGVWVLPQTPRPFDLLKKLGWIRTGDYILEVEDNEIEIERIR